MTDQPNPDPSDEVRSFILRNGLSMPTHQESLGTRLLKWQSINGLVDALNNPKAQRTRGVKLAPSSYDRNDQLLKIGNDEASYKTAPQASAILDITFTSRNMSKSRWWTFAHFLKTYKTRLAADGMKTSKQVRTAVETVNKMAAKQTDYRYTDIFSIDHGFGINPRYRPKKQR